MTGNQDSIKTYSSTYGFIEKGATTQTLTLFVTTLLSKYQNCEQK